MIELYEHELSNIIYYYNETLLYAKLIHYTNMFDEKWKKNMKQNIFP